MNDKLKISEIFYSIQGESSYVGLPCVFIRLSGCNLRCNYCDADYTWEDGNSQSIESLLSAVDRYPCAMVEVTGGEPLFQENCPELLEKLVEHGKTVFLETNGSLTITNVPDKIISILDVKCPYSESEDTFDLDNIRLIRQRLLTTPGSCELRFVLSTKNDYLWAKDFIVKYELSGLLPILFFPGTTSCISTGSCGMDNARWPGCSSAAPAAHHTLAGYQSWC